MDIFFKKFFTFKNYFILVIVVIFVLIFFAKQFPFFPFDLYITKQIQLITTPVVEQLLLFVTWLGNFYKALFSLLIFSLALFIYGFRKESLILTMSTLGAVSISETLKLLVLRPRPDPLLIKQAEFFYRNDSFPSGHVLFFMGFYGFLMFLAFIKVRKSSVRNFLVGGLLGLIILIGVSRIYLGSHWFSDVIGAYLIGGIWLYFVILIYKKIKVQ